MMIATKCLPEGFVLRREINLQKDQSLLVKLNLWGLLLLLPIGFLLLWAAVALHPAFHSIPEVLTPLIPITRQILALILGLIVTLVLHELVHGAFFWISTRQSPKFGFRGAYAFAAAPEWYIQRSTYFFIGAAPLVILSAIGVICIPLIPPAFMITWLFCLLTNASGAIGDVFILAVLISQPATAMIQDRGDVISVFSETAN
jgi:hypothetical protein